MIRPVDATGAWLTRGVTAMVILLAVGVRSPAPLDAAATRQSAPMALLDLAAMTPLPGDVQGHEVVLGPGAMLSAGEVAEQATALGTRPGPTERTLEDAGWQRGYANSLSFADIADPDDPARSLRMSGNQVAEFTDETGAAAWFAFRTGQDRLDAGRDRAAEVVAGAATVGDESWLVRLASTETDGDDADYDGLWLTFRRDRIVADLRLSDASAETLELDRLEGMATAFARRIDAALDADEPGLGSLALRLKPLDEAPFFLPFDNYMRRDGETVPQRFESSDGFAYRDARYGAATDVYSLQHYLLPGAEERHETDAYYSLMLLRFADEGASADWVEGTPNSLKQNDIELEIVEGADGFGDASVTLSVPYTRDGGAEQIRSFVVVLGVGDIAAWVEIAAPFDAPIEAVEELAAAQVACLEVGACPEPVPLPAVLAEG